MKPRVFLTAAVAALASAPTFAAPPAAAPGPWAKVPALPTACYASQDQWWNQNNAAIEAVQQDHYRQNDVNSAIAEKANEALNANPMAMAQALQQKMMDDPANAQKYMEQMVQQGEQLQTEIPAQLEKEKQLETESQTVMKQYQAVLAKAMGPGNARWAALRKKYGLPDDAYGPGESGVPDWVWKEWNVILKEWDQGYVTTCATWWAATGPIHGYMKRYKDYLVRERIPYEKKLGDEPALDQYKMLNVSTTGWRTTTDYEAAEDYMRTAINLFREREQDPRCRKETYCE